MRTFLHISYELVSALVERLRHKNHDLEFPGLIIASLENFFQIVDGCHD